MNISDIEMTPLLAFFSTFGIFSFGYIISAFTASYLSYLPLHDELEDDDTLYENMINEKFTKLDIRDLSNNYINNLGNNFAREMTSQGEVILCYNTETESFNYWCDSKSISFKTLELVSKKYVIDYNCKTLYKYKEQPEGDKEQPESDKEQPESDKDTSTKQNVFANLKEYNKNNKKITTEIVKNRYSYRGNIENWNIDINKKIVIDNSNSELSFKSFKNSLT